MTIGDPYSRDAAVSGRSVAVSLRCAPVRYEAGDPALERFRRNWLVSGIGEAGQARPAPARARARGGGGRAARARRSRARRGSGGPGVTCPPVFDGGGRWHDRHL